MVTAHSTTRTVTAKSGMILPATITPQTDFNLMDTACIVYQRFNEYRVAYDTLEKVKDAMRDGSAVATMYCDAKGETSARVIWPSSLTLSAANDITCKGYCTLRGKVRCFRLSRMLTVHPLTTPDDILGDDEGSTDWEDSYSAREPALYR